MVCPNCHSDQIIAVQDQHFCINCGQMVPPPKVGAAAKTVKSKAAVAVQSNGLPVGVQILSDGPAKDAVAELANDIKDLASAEPEPAVTAVVPAPKIVRSRTRIGFSTSATGTETKPSTKKRKPGRPKAGKLDVPRVAETVIEPVNPAPLPEAPKIVTSNARTGGIRSLSDIAPRKGAPVQPQPLEAAPAMTPKDQTVPSKPIVAISDPMIKPAVKAVTPEQVLKHHKKGHVHRVGVPALHFGPVFAFVLRARLRPRLVAVATLGSVSLAVISGYLAWLTVSQGVNHLADSLMQAGPKLGFEIGLLGLLYYIGRNISQAALTYGIARESDQRPVSLSRQFGVAVNSFTRHLELDFWFGLGSLTILGGAVALFITGGGDMAIDQNLQIGLIFVSYLAMLYGLIAIAISRGLARTNVTLTTHKPITAVKVGWRLFSHRLELIGPRCGALALEAILAFPLIALGVAGIATAPESLHLIVVAGAALLAGLAGALIGVGTAAWWTMLYRQLVLADHTDNAIAFLSSRQPEDAKRGPLSLLVATVTIIVVIALALPWVQIVK